MGKREQKRRKTLEGAEESTAVRDGRLRMNKPEDFSRSSKGIVTRRCIR